MFSLIVNFERHLIINILKLYLIYSNNNQLK